MRSAGFPTPSAQAPARLNGASAADCAGSRNSPTCPLGFLPRLETLPLEEHPGVLAPDAALPRPPPGSKGVEEGAGHAGGS